MHEPTVAFSMSPKQMMNSNPHGSAVMPRNVPSGSTAAVEIFLTETTTLVLKAWVDGPTSIFIVRSI